MALRRAPLPTPFQHAQGLIVAHRYHVTGVAAMTDRSGALVESRAFRLDSGPRRLRWVPDGRVRILLGVDGRLALICADRPFAAPLYGLRTRPLVADLHGIGVGVLVSMEPLVAFRLGLAMRELVNAAIEVALSPLAELVCAVTASPRRAVAAAVRAWIEERAAAGRPYHPDVFRAWRELARTRGRIAVTALAAHVNLGQRQLEQRFRQQTGLTPKVAARVFRFGHARRLLAAGLPMTKVAAECGYYDHAHLCHEFQAMAGLTPTAYSPPELRT